MEELQESDEGESSVMWGDNDESADQEVSNDLIRSDLLFLIFSFLVCFRKKRLSILTDNL
ncbi:unnamed protein product [Cuscuta epithymum]|uniref:Uncharacterized protein n=1 Tax=Cuscuta epithymum TaxID=186058 RepID=A0AAV0EFZ6_9ASTE|nr:unnamed protein product [Cuscuta epithymum]